MEWGGWLSLCVSQTQVEARLFALMAWLTDRTKTAHALLEGRLSHQPAQSGLRLRHGLSRKAPRVPGTCGFCATQDLPSILPGSMESQVFESSVVFCGLNRVQDPRVGASGTAPASRRTPNAARFWRAPFSVAAALGARRLAAAVEAFGGGAQRLGRAGRGSGACLASASLGFRLLPCQFGPGLVWIVLDAFAFACRSDCKFPQCPGRMTLLKNGKAPNCGLFAGVGSWQPTRSFLRFSLDASRIGILAGSSRLASCG